MRKFGKMGIQSEDITIISETSSLEGKLEMLGDVIIMGSFRGSITSRTLRKEG
jgi:cytoskeletal protein CcmA (bactofilin family)